MTGPGEERRLQELLLQAALRLMERLDGPQHAPLSVRVSGSEGRRFDLSGLPADSTAVDAVLNSTPGELAVKLERHFFTPLECRIVLMLAGGPLSGKVVRARLGDRKSTKVQLALAGLVERGVLGTSRDGYHVCDPAFVEIAKRVTPKSGC